MNERSSFKMETNDVTTESISGNITIPSFSFFETTGVSDSELYGNKLSSEFLNVTPIPATSPPYENFCQLLKELGSNYNLAHGYLSLIFCCFGTVANMLNVFVFTRPGMKNSTNLILTALGISDLCKLVEYIPYIIYEHFLPDEEGLGSRKTKWWAYYVLFHSNFSLWCHTISIWLTSLVAFWRCIMISAPLQSRIILSRRYAKRWIYAGSFTSVLLCLPFSFMFSVQVVPPPGSSPSTSGVYPPDLMAASPLSYFAPRVKYIVNLSDYAMENPTFVRINLWYFSIFHKIIPCIVNTFSCIRLIYSIWKAAQHRLLLRASLSPPSIVEPPPEEAPSLSVAVAVNDIPLRERCMPATAPATRPNTLPIRASPSGGGDLESEQFSFCGGSTSHSMHTSTPGGETYMTSRTTIMLLIVMTLFLVTELPQGIIALLSAIYGREFFHKCYNAAAPLMDFLALLNCSLNIIPYIVMNRRFRSELGSISTRWR